MNREEIQKWVYDLKRLPNTRRGLALAYVAQLLYLLFMLYFSLSIWPWLTGNEIVHSYCWVAEGVAIVVFFTWARYTLKFKGERR